MKKFGADCRKSKKINLLMQLIIDEIKKRVKKIVFPDYSKTILGEYYFSIFLILFLS